MSDANGCTGSAGMTVHLQVGVVMDAQAVTTLPSCNGGANGTAMLHVQTTDCESATITVLDENGAAVGTVNLPSFYSGPPLTYTITGLPPAIIPCGTRFSSSSAPISITRMMRSRSRTFRAIVVR
jgi:hypothetical protein